MNIAITGSEGFIGSNLYNYLNELNKFSLYKICRKNVNLLDINAIKSYIINNKIDIVIHTAIEGGFRNDKNGIDCVYNNIMMMENLISCRDFFKLLINFGSGIENSFNGYPPTSYYGFSKYVIYNLIRNQKNFVNLKIFGCFYHNEHSDRMIKSNIQNYINNTPMIIHKNKWMDFIYLEDLCKIVDFYVENWDIMSLPVNVDMVYLTKYMLSDICDMINNLTPNKVDIKIQSDEIDNDYIGDGLLLNSINIPMVGMSNGIKQCYNNLKHTYKTIPT